MIIGCCFICVFAVLVNEVSLQVTEEGFIGGSVELPCFFTERDLKLQEIHVNWRHNGSEILYDIVKGKDAVEKQNPRYKNRTKTFPNEYLRGNFSIRLNNLTPDDAGEFNCFITHSSELQTVLLIINESTAKGNESHEQKDQGEETEADNVEISSVRHHIVAAVVSFIVVLVAAALAALMIYCFLIQRKGSRASICVKTDGERSVTQTC